MERQTIWLIDGAYLMNAAPGRFDYLKLKQLMEEENGGPIAESYYLNSSSQGPTDAQNSFHTWLKTAPPNGPRMRVVLYRLKSVHLECPSCKTPYSTQTQKGVDVGIATLIVKLAVMGHYDRLILSAGDGDLEDAIVFVKDTLKKEFWLTGFDGSTSSDIQSYADHMIWLDDHWEKFKK